MRDHYRGSPFHGSIESLLDNLLTALIQGRSGLVKDQDSGVFDESPSDRNSLLLASGELATLQTAVLVEALVKLELSTCWIALLVDGHVHELIVALFHIFHLVVR